MKNKTHLKNNLKLTTMASLTNTLYFGIDLGTTFSSICSVDASLNFNFLSFNGQDVIPTTVVFPQRDTQGYEFGTSFSKSGNNNILYETKRLMGLTYDSQPMQRLIEAKRFDSFTIVRDDDGWVMVEYQEKGRAVRKYPWEISAMFLKFLHDRVCERHAFDTKKELNAVISVPANFTHFQRRDTAKAAKMAGFNVKIINEPTAAAIAFGSSTRSNERVLVFDFGGGTLDVTIMDISRRETKSTFTVLATFGDMFLGGVDFDEIITNLIIRKIQQESPNDYERLCCTEGKTDAQRRKVRSFLTKLRKASIDLKEQRLSCGMDASLDLNEHEDSLEGDLFITITYASFLEASRHLFDRCMDCVDEVLGIKGTEAMSIDTLYLVGGSSCFTELHRRLNEKFPGKVTSDLAGQKQVAKGDALFGQALLGSTSTFEIVDVCPMSLGIAETIGNSRPFVKTLIKGSTPIPVDSQVYVSRSSYLQKEAVFAVYQGDDIDPCFENLVVVFIIHNLPQLGEYCIQFETRMHYDRDGMVHVTTDAFVHQGERKRRIKFKPAARCEFSVSDCESREQSKLQDIEFDGIEDDKPTAV